MRIYALGDGGFSSLNNAGHAWISITNYNGSPLENRRIDRSRRQIHHRRHMGQHKPSQDFGTTQKDTRRAPACAGEMLFLSKDP